MTFNLYRAPTKLKLNEKRIWKRQQIALSISGVWSRSTPPPCNWLTQLSCSSSNWVLSTQLLDEHVSASYKQPSSTPSAFCCAWRPHRSTDKDSPLRSMQLCCRWPVNVKCATCTTTQRRTLPCHFIASWRLNYTLEHIMHTSTLVTVFTVRVGEHNFIVLTYLH